LTKPKSVFENWKLEIENCLNKNKKMAGDKVARHFFIFI